MNRNQQDFDAVEMYTQWRPIFDRYDDNKDGQIPLDYLKDILTEASANEIPPRVIEEILERADWDKNRQLSYDEFVRMVHANELGNAKPRFQSLVWFAARAVVPTRQRASTVRRYIEEYNCYPPPVFMILVTILEIAAFIYYSIELNELNVASPVPYRSVLIYNPCFRHQAWRFLTYMFIHAGGVHIFFNVLIQLLLGVPLEMVHKFWRVGLVYLLGVISGSVASALVDPGTLLAGASGGVYALIGAHLANVIINFKEMDFGCIRLATLLGFGAFDIGVALYYRYALNIISRTSYAAHIAGAMTGLMLGMIILKNLVTHKWENKCGIFLLALYAIIMGSIIVILIASPGIFPASDSYFCQYFKNPN